MKNPSTHISWSELACNDGTPYPSEFIADKRYIPLVEAFEIIRSNCGNRPIEILSAYRTLSHNRKVGGARNSQHLLGKALDLRAPYGWSVDKFYSEIKKLAIPQIKGIGKYKTFVHMDVRESARVAYWFGNGVKDDRP